MTKFFNEILDTTQTDKRTPQYYKAVDWNIVNAIDKATWEKLTSQFWTDTRVPVSNDLKDWRLLSDLEKEVFNHAFAGLTMLDTLQSEEGAYKLKKAAKSQHEEAIYNNLLFMESIKNACVDLMNRNIHLAKLI